MKDREIYWYDDHIMNQVIIGWRGGSEFRVDRWEFMQEVLRTRTDSKEDPILYLKIAMRLSQYIDFEEVTEPQKLLS